MPVNWHAARIVSTLPTFGTDDGRLNDHNSKSQAVRRRDGLPKESVAELRRMEFVQPASQVLHPLSQVANEGTKVRRLRSLARTVMI